MALADADVGIGTLKIPLSIKRLQPSGRQGNISVWSHFKLIDFTDHHTSFRSWLLNDAGEALLYFDRVHLQEVRDEHIKEVLRKTQSKEQKVLYDVNWQEYELPEPKPSGERLVLCQEEVANHLGELDSTWTLVTHDPDSKDRNLLDVDAVANILQQKKWEAVAIAEGLSDSEGGDMDGLEMALKVVQAASRNTAKAPPLWLLTCGTQPNASEDVDIRRKSTPLQAGIFGFARAVRMEFPGALQVHSIDFDPRAHSESLGTALKRWVPALIPSREDELAVRVEAGEKCYVPRLTRSVVPIGWAMQLEMLSRGSLTNLKLVPQEKRKPLKPGFVQVRIRAIGLNFRDVLNVMGLYPGDPGMPGADFSGTVIELTPEVTNVSLGEDIFGEAEGALCTYNPAYSALCAKKPPEWTYEAACAMPVIFVTVEESLGDIAKLKKGERVLIHAAAGGVGLVAIQYAQWVGAIVYATAGSETKHEYLRGLGVTRIATSRNGEQFAAEMKELLKKDKVSGVDVVLNSLSHDDYIPRSLALLNKNGKFMEIGKRGIWSYEQMAEERPDVLYKKIAADTMMYEEPWRYNDYLKRLLTRVQEGGLRPINLHIFEGLEKGVQAFQFLQRAQNIGKVVITVPSRMGCKPDDRPHLLTGGMGALGLVTAKFLVEEGAKKVVPLSRSGKPGASVEAQWQWLQACDVEVNALACDVSKSKGVRVLRDSLGNGPIAGVVHLAGVLADGMIPSLTRESFEESYGPKVVGLRRIHVQLQAAADTYWMLFSSTSSLFGSPGQANYSASNSVLDSLAAHWKSLGQNAWAVQWGPWGEVGMAVEKNTLARGKSMGVGSIPNDLGMSIMAGVMVNERAVVGAAVVRWNKYLSSVYADVPLFLEEFKPKEETSVVASAAGGAAPASGLAAMSDDERLEAVTSSIAQLAREVTGSDDLDNETPLLEAGMDSLSGVEFRNRLVSEFAGVRMANTLVFDYPNISALAGYISGELGGMAPAEGPGASSPATPAAPTAATAAVSTGPMLIDKLNDKGEGIPLFLAPGVFMAAEGFRELASMLPVPVWGLGWPKGAKPREEWPETLDDLAQIFLDEVRKVRPEGPYHLGGHSFGATVALRMAQLLEKAGESVELVVLLDPRSLPPLQADISYDFTEGGITNSLAILSQAGSAADGSRYSEMLDRVFTMHPDSPERREAALKAELSPAVLASLEHMHATSVWYGKLIGEASKGEPLKVTSGTVAVLRTAETWNEAPSAENPEGPAKAAVREFEAKHFQNDRKVAELTEKVCKGANLTSSLLPGDHFSMLRAPHALGMALRVCRSLDELQN
eukprot:gnl/MRDRNA2_/MRDRNA2_78811_c0_seq1.p1 gnl/MRDRNA2_/MRDRNA2_78811_c0~~gnl/MRDRNA2_/MRDRNA2_78811_c0_seq1.p1  ORF type:complete len:1358 (+),score=334.40 gnl/MRDRNA2_/MRDRNA2_78811_c0_seq1:121-4074(+)